MNSPEARAERERARKIADSLRGIERAALFDAFLMLDTVMIALAPDASPSLAEAWSYLHDRVHPDDIARRDEAVARHT